MNVEQAKSAVRYWLVLNAGHQTGPFPEPELLAKIEAGAIGAQALASCGNGWVPIADVIGSMKTAVEGATPAAGNHHAVAGVAPGDQSQLPPPHEALPQRDRIVILGRRQAGKTVFLATLYARLWRSRNGLSAKALSGAVHKRLIESYELLQNGQWPPATLGASQVELEIEHHGRKHLLVTLDFAGELFAQAFLNEQLDRPETRNLMSHIDRAAAVLLLIDPGVSEGIDRQAATEDDFGLVQAMQRIRNWPGGEQVPLVLVLTKIDQYQHLVKRFGNLGDLVRHQFPAFVREIKRISIFPVSAVQVTKGSDGVARPAGQCTRSTNLEDPLSFCLREIERNQEDHARIKNDQEQQITAAAHERAERRQNRLLTSVIAFLCLAGAAIAYWIIRRKS